MLFLGVCSRLALVQNWLIARRSRRNCRNRSSRRLRCCFGLHHSIEFERQVIRRCQFFGSGCCMRRLRGGAICSTLLFGSRRTTRTRTTALCRHALLIQHGGKIGSIGIQFGASWLGITISSRFRRLTAAGWKIDKLRKTFAIGLGHAGIRKVTTATAGCCCSVSYLLIIFVALIQQTIKGIGRWLGRQWLGPWLVGVSASSS